MILVRYSEKKISKYVLEGFIGQAIYFSQEIELIAGSE
jgi:hypothetical protein